MIGRDGTRDEVIAKYRAWIVQQPALMGRCRNFATRTWSAGARQSGVMLRC